MTMQLRVLVTITASLGLIACTAMIKEIAAGPEIKCIVLDGHVTSETNRIHVIKGAVRNDCQRAYGSVTVSFRLEPAPGANGGITTRPMAFGYVHDLKPGETKEFETLPIGSNPSTMFDKITAF